MTLEEFKKEKITAMKAREADKVTALNVVISKLMLLTIEKRANNEELTDADVTSVLKKTEKELLEERESFAKANRTETVASLDKQIEAIKKYMPQLMTAEEIKQIILSQEDRSVPSVMKLFKTQYAGKCDMGLVNTVLKTL